MAKSDQETAAKPLVAHSKSEERRFAAQAPRRVVLSAHKITLEGLEEGWTDECYALVTYAGYDELKTLQGLDVEELKKQADITSVDFMKKIVDQHFVGGKILLLDADNQPYVGDMLPEDVAITFDVLTYLFKSIIGQGKTDPKATAPEAPSADAPTSTENTTATT